jgi:hypothetical protein
MAQPWTPPPQSTRSVPSGQRASQLVEPEHVSVQEPRHVISQSEEASQVTSVPASTVSTQSAELPHSTMDDSPIVPRHSAEPSQRTSLMSPPVTLQSLLSVHATSAAPVATVVQFSSRAQVVLQSPSQSRVQAPSAQVQMASAHRQSPAVQVASPELPQAASRRAKAKAGSEGVGRMASFSPRTWCPDGDVAFRKSPSAIYARHVADGFFRRWDEAAGPFTAALERFLSHHRGAPETLGAGPEGLRRLADAIEAWAEDGDEDGDDAFVEGAGAALALLLLDHLGEGRHRAREGTHRLQLGRYGSIDPFAIVDACLDADDVRATLSAGVRAAEAEARGEDGHGRIRRHLEAALGERLDAFGPRAWMADGTELDLERLRAATDGERDAFVEAAVGRVVSLLQSPGPRSLEVERLFPRLVGPAFEAAPRGAAHGRLCLQPALDGALRVGLVLAYEGRARYVREDELEAAGVSARDALLEALQNLAATAGRARFGEVETSEGPMVVARSGDGHDAARVLLPPLREVLEPSLGVDIVVGVPHRDALWATAPAGRGALAARCRREFRRAPHPVRETPLVLP